VIFEKIRDCIMSRTNLSESVVTMQASLRDDLCLDSFDLAELGIELEDVFAVTIPDEDLIAFHTVSDIVTFMKNSTK